MNKSIVLKASGLKKRYKEGDREVCVLKGVDLEVRAGESVAIVGTSGSGKTTLLQCLGGLDRFDEGSIEVGGENLANLNEKGLTELRNRKLGFVYQFHHLLAEFTALENVAMPLKIRRESAPTAQNRAVGLLNAMGLKDRADHLPSQLSGGERQRVAIARAVSGSPICLLADEPTGNLDGETAESVMDYLMKLSGAQGLALIIVTHDPDVAARCGRIVRLKDGKIQPEAF